MNSKQNLKIWIICLIFISLIFLIIFRMFYLQVVKYDFFKDQSMAQQKRKITLHPNRGDIFDRNGLPLAFSSKAYSVYLDPRYKNQDKDLVIKEMVEILDINREKAEQLFRMDSYILVKPKIDKETALSLSAKGFDLLPDIIRNYPGKQLASHFLGYVGWDNEGKDGLEKKYDNILSGKAGYMILESDIRGRSIFSDRRKVFPVKDGDEVETTIDKYMQFFLEEALEKGIIDLEAKSGVGIIMDVHNGEIFAMASYPAYDPNEYSEYYSKDPTSFWNRAVFMDYEPGSVMKLFTIGAALEEGVVKKDEQLFCPQRLVVDRTVIEEAHDAQQDDVLTKDIAEILIKSLNVGAAKIGLSLGAEKLYNYFVKLGFGKVTGIDLPGESSGSFRHFSRWYKVDLSRIAFGYGMTATPLQLVRATASLANGGELVQPHLVRTGTKLKKERVFSKDTAAYLLEVMKRTVEEGTAGATKIDKYQVGGKTGTAILFSPEYNRYLAGQYNSTFVGVFPVSNPKFAMLIMVNDPQRRKYASYSAVPIFKEVAERVIRYLDIEPNLDD